ncbi:hypothetical protein R3P38DRAFT_2925325 [Favolaschia claudopus]|uniref:TNT domain-containing protein n=1 Tax=Favolaschia claudopus TaxID=2862362 RepID=A0AAW0BXW0_9AGAR
MRWTSTLAVFLTVLAVSASPITTQSKCHGCRGITGNDTRYFCGDSRLGPAVFPKTKPLVAILANYDRFGGLCPDEFLQKYTNASTGSFVYPPQEGFQLSNTSMPIDGNQTLTPGLLLDRFGSEFGMFLAPAYTPFGQRALPPSSLNKPADGHPVGNYHLYKVEREFTVLTGTIASWFNQPGQGTQYLADTNVMMLVQEGFLSRVGG